ncbi:MAG TPA: hypothetical protein VN831_00825, partial [Bradyrhizobium sp.]|nr:hypothetical protein [Bradyrhizobium sp.]
MLQSVRFCALQAPTGIRQTEYFGARFQRKWRRLCKTSLRGFVRIPAGIRREMPPEFHHRIISITVAAALPRGAATWGVRFALPWAA